MTMTITPDTTVSTGTKSESLLRTGAKAAALAAVATTVIAVAAHAVGVSFESAPGEAIPILGFAQMTLLFSMVGVLIARVLRSRARHPRSTFVRTTVVLTALSFVPDLTMSFDAASKLALMTTHIVAAAIVIPTLAARLDERHVG